MSFTEKTVVILALSLVIVLSCALWGGDIQPETLRSWVGASR
jgi:hypothetical protein